MPLLCLAMFVVGGMTEAAMTFSGFYSVYTVNEAKKKAEQQIQQEQLWETASIRRKQRQDPPFSLLLLRCLSTRFVSPCFEPLVPVVLYGVPCLVSSSLTLAAAAVEIKD
ncbi:transmembrane protein [Cyclospora cayetanensis]|uniref:Transmembrane protein n=1 Tax=Cyclospora cayetanensis TaxID=88456 RepID=A0A1D3CZZ8_9EIME|nr:transmembrane protein [Cyclospora cayetanensis]